MKKMNKMLLLPLFLGGVTLASAGLISAVNVLTEPIIQTNVMAKENEGNLKILGVNKIDVKLELALNEKLINGGVKAKQEFKLEGLSIGIVYDVEISAYSSDLQFQVGFKNEKYAGFNVVTSKETKEYGGVLLDQLNDFLKDKPATENAPIPTDLMAGKSITGRALNTALGICADDYMEGVN